MDPLRRFDAHKYYYDQYIKYSSGTKSYAHEILKYDDVEFVILEQIEVADKDELKKLENKYFLEMRANLVNKNAPIDTNEERRNAQRQYQMKYKSLKNLCSNCGKCLQAQEISA